MCANYYINMQTVYGSSTIVSSDNSTSDSNVTERPHKRSGGVVTDVPGLADYSGWMQTLPLLTIDNIEAGGLWVHIAFEWIITMTVVLLSECSAGAFRVR